MAAAALGCLEWVVRAVLVPARSTKLLRHLASVASPLRSRQFGVFQRGGFSSFTSLSSHCSRSSSAGISSQSLRFCTSSAVSASSRRQRVAGQRQLVGCRAVRRRAEYFCVRWICERPRTVARLAHVLCCGVYRLHVQHRASLSVCDVLTCDRLFWCAFLEPRAVRRERAVAAARTLDKRLRAALHAR